MASKTIKNLAVDQGDGEQPFLATDALLKEDATANPEWGTVGALRGVSSTAATESVALVDPVTDVAGVGELNISAGDNVRSNSASPITLTIALADIENGWNCTVVKFGDGDVTIAAGAGMTLRSVSAVIYRKNEQRWVARFDAFLFVWGHSPAIEDDVAGTSTILASDIGTIKRYTGSGDIWTMNTLSAVGEVAVENDGTGAITFTGTATRSGATMINPGKSGTLRYFNSGAKVKVMAEG